MIAYHYGLNLPLSYLRTLCESNKLGISLHDFNNIFKQISFDSAALTIRDTDVYRMPLPAIIFWDQCHFVVLYQIDLKKGLFHIADPDEGIIKLSVDEFFNHWKQGNEKGIVVVAEPNQGAKIENVKQGQSDKGLAKLLRQLFIDYRSQFLKAR